MSAAPTQSPVRVSYEEYCRLEALAETKHDYDNGRVVAMAGGSLSHGRIISNINGECRARLKSGPCEILSEFRISFPRRTYSHYSDGMIVCGQPEIDPRDSSGQSLTNPKVIVEVLSPTTADFDRGTKFDRYRELPSFREYVVVFQDRAEVQTSFKQDDGTWLLRTFTGLAGDVPLTSIGIALPLAEIYARVTFDDAKDES